ncbi:glycosyltransferase family 2 protein [Vibrio hippocampi]|uniref:Lipid A biosynthesis lauroyltransferase n=1 Tax=Vibrio hippocampi TaxID=654686 RepID=A0ABM8ZMB1_9VIBR|nr:glycosyltransferase family 2 protein [Vibrio hippocampi]CAH0529173.1 Lipid A biosynthesis lauroyltransferase [Vibrio hippocampi]
MSNYQACFLIPCYNHGSTVADVIASLQPFELPFILVDDGSDLPTQQVLASLAEQSNVELVRLDQNQGKGGAVMAGIRQAQTLGYSHVIQIDADGQHDIDALPKLMQASQHHPERLISGQPIYDDSVPKSRLYGRYATHIWVWIETLSFSIKDSMCGFRAYPVKQTVVTLDKYQIGRRMDFDIEILVRMYWQGVDIDFVETRVIYPEGGISHFDALWDNLKISWMHTRLFFGMLPRIPALLARKRPPASSQDTATQGSATQNTTSTHWSKRSEQGTIIGIKCLLTIYKLFGRKAFDYILRLVIRYYHMTGKQSRAASELYLQQLQSHAKQQQIELPQPLDSYQHLLSFGRTMLDKLAAWSGDFSFDNLTIHGQQHVDQILAQDQGVLILGSHLGNLELCRALSKHYSSVKINALVFTEHAERFNSVMKAVNPDSELNLIQVSSMGPDTAIMLQQKIEQGEWVVIVGDRTSTTQETRSIYSDFLGKPAPFPTGPFMLASVLEAPVYLLFGLRDDSSEQAHFDVHFEPFCDKVTLPRKTRQQALQSVVDHYAQRLEYFTLKAPLQWYNFFNFWTLSDQSDEPTKK